MISVDTNILIRYFVRDDPRQAEVARRFLEEHLSSDRPGWLSLVTVAETSWVLNRRYKLTAPEVREIVEIALETQNFTFERPDAVRLALTFGLDDFGDALIHALGQLAGCEQTVTFDIAFAKLPGVKLLDSGYAA